MATTFPTCLAVATSIKILVHNGRSECLTMVTGDGELNQPVMAGAGAGWCWLCTSWLWSGRVHSGCCLILKGAAATSFEIIVSMIHVVCHGLVEWYFMGSMNLCHFWCLKCPIFGCYCRDLGWCGWHFVDKFRRGNHQGMRNSRRTGTGSHGETQRWLRLVVAGWVPLALLSAESTRCLKTLVKRRRMILVIDQWMLPTGRCSTTIQFANYTLSNGLMGILTAYWCNYHSSFIV